MARQRPAMFGIPTAFFLATATGWVMAGAVAVFVLGDVDPKFRQAPSVAFQVELTVGAIFTVLSTVVVGIATAMLRNKLSINRACVLVTIAWGLAYPLLWRLLIARALERFDAESLVVAAAGWVYLVVFPLLMFLVLTRLGSQGPRGQGAF